MGWGGGGCHPNMINYLLSIYYNILPISFDQLIALYCGVGWGGVGGTSHPLTDYLSASYKYQRQEAGPH